MMLVLHSDRQKQMMSIIDVVTVLACVTRKMLGKEVLDHLGNVEQYYR